MQERIEHANRERLVIVCGPLNSDDRFAFRGGYAKELRHILHRQRRFTWAFGRTEGMSSPRFLLLDTPSDKTCQKGGFGSLGSFGLQLLAVSLFELA